MALGQALIKQRGVYLHEHTRRSTLQMLVLLISNYLLVQEKRIQLVRKQNSCVFSPVHTILLPASEVEHRHGHGACIRQVFSSATGTSRKEP